MDLRVQGAPGAGAWLALPTSDTTINDDVVQQDPQRCEVAHKMWAGVPLPPEVTLSRRFHTVNTVHGPQKKAVPLSTSHLLSCTKGGHCNARHNDVRDEISKMCRTAGMQVSRECLLPEVRRVVNGVRESRLSQLRTDLRTTDDPLTWQSHTQRGKKATTRRCYRRLTTESARSYRSTAATKGHTSPPTSTCSRGERNPSSRWWPRPGVVSAKKPRGLINLCATLAKSYAAPGFNSKLKAELTSKFM